MLLGWAVAAVLVLGGLLLEPMARVVSPTFAVGLASRWGSDEALTAWIWSMQDELDRGRTPFGAGLRPDDGDVWESPPSLRDPWGARWRIRARLPVDPRGDPFYAWTWAYSVGPDGHDDRGLGDDVMLRPMRATFRGGALVHWRIREEPGRVLIICGAALAAYAALAWRFVPSRRGSIALELVRSIVLAAPWASAVLAYLAAIGSSYWRDEAAREVEAALALRVPAEFAVIGTVILATVSLALAWRLTRPRADEASSPGVSRPPRASA